MTNLHPEAFLLRPRPIGTESLRGFLSRLAAVNLVPRCFWPLMGSLEVLTELTIGYAGEDIIEPVALHHRIASHRHRKAIQLGHETLLDSCLLMSRRRVCPACLAEDGIARMEWEVKACMACPRHRCMLLSKCPSCARHLTWTSSEITNCGCGQSLTEAIAEPASMSEVGISRLLHVALRTSMKTREQASLSTRTGTPLRLEKLLLLVEIVQHVFLPEHVPRGLSRSDELRLTVLILRDRFYRDYLWDKVFLHAASDPMRMAEMLQPGRGGSSIRQDYADLARDLHIPQALWPFVNLQGPDDCSVARSCEPFVQWLHGVGLCQLHSPWSREDEEEQMPHDMLFAD